MNLFERLNLPITARVDIALDEGRVTLEAEGGRLGGRSEACELSCHDQRGEEQSRVVGEHVGLVTFESGGSSRLCLGIFLNLEWTAGVEVKESKVKAESVMGKRSWRRGLGGLLI